MVSQSDQNAPTVASATKTSKCKIVKGSRPLVNFRFYLDIANHHTSLKVETKITELGGTIEFFLTESVTHFITDKVPDKEQAIVASSPCTPTTPQSISVSHCEVSSSNDLKADQKIKTRADAMLHRARKGAYESADKFSQLQKSPTQVAKSRGIVIWSPDFALKFLEKVHAVVKNHFVNHSSSKTKQRIGNAKILKGDFIKIESTEKHYRPYYQLIAKSKWPKVNINSRSDLSIFHYTNEQPNTEVRYQAEDLQEIKSTTTPDMTRKSRSSKHIRVKSDKKIPSEKQCGYCEICRVEYDSLTTHLKSDEHINFVKNDTNFLELDTLIKTNTSMDSFIINKETMFKQTPCDVYPKKLATRHYKGATASFEQKDTKSDSLAAGMQTRQTSVRQAVTSSVYSSQLKSTGIVRARRESAKKVNYAEPKEDEENSNDMVIAFQKAKKTPEKRVRKNNVTPVANSSPPRPKPKTPLLYKVIETKDKFPSDKKEPLSEKNNEQSIIVKFRKIRQTELSLLNGEAENFMFPKKFSEISTDTDRHTSESGGGATSSSIISSEKPSSKRKSSTSSHNNITEFSDAPKKRRNCSQNNVRVHESSSTCQNHRYPDQSFRRSPIHPRRKNIREKRLSSNNNVVYDENLQGDEMGEITPTNLQEFLDGGLNKYNFSFERIPHKELWYQVFHRQDESKEKMFEYYGNTAYRKLPYEMGPLPPLQPTFCKLCLSNGVPLRATEEMQVKVEDGTTSNEKDASSLNAPRMKKSRTQSLLSLEMPRKSPREHASTLAILSCLINQRSDKTSKDSPVPIKTELVDEIEAQLEDNNELDKVVEPNSPEKPPDPPCMQISPQISENVKRMRRGEKLKAKAAAKDEKRQSLQKKNSCRRRERKPLEFDMDEKSLYSQNDSYINVHKLRSEIDCHLQNSYTDFEELDGVPISPEDDIDHFIFDVSLTDLILDDKSTNGNGRVRQTKAASGRLRLYNIFSTNKKRKNKTGWPTKKKASIRQPQFAKFTNVAQVPNVEAFPIEVKRELISAESPITPPETDSEEKIESATAELICKEEPGPNPNISYFIAREKVETSDLSMVSSDSLDTVLDVGSQMKSEDQQEVIETSKSTIKLTSLPCTVDKSAKGMYRKKFKAKSCRLLLKRTPIPSSAIRNNVIIKAEPVIEDLQHVPESSEDTCNSKSDIQKVPDSISSAATAAALSLSPRRLRKPRGKWYRER